MRFLDLIRMISHPTLEPMDSVFPNLLSKIVLFGKRVFFQHGGGGANLENGVARKRSGA